MKNKIIAVVKFNEGEAYVLNHAPVFKYKKQNNVIVGTDGVFASCYFNDPSSRNFEAFGGRKFDIELENGEVEHCHGQWWDGIKPEAIKMLGTYELVHVTYGTKDHLKKCYVFYGCTGIKNEIEKLRKQYHGKVYDYWEYEKIMRIEKLWDENRKLQKAQSILLEYYKIRHEMLDLTKQINNDYAMDTHPVGPGVGICLSNHVRDYFEADKENRKEGGDSMEFSEYCMDVLHMDDTCPQCAHVLVMIRQRRELGIKLGTVKNKIMAQGRKLQEK